MAASYPSSAKTYTTKTTGDTIAASHINDLQDEVTALEQALLSSGLAHNVFPSGTRTLGTSSAFWDKVYGTALIVGAETTSGVRLDIESGALAVREGDDSAYAPLKALTLEITTTSTLTGVATLTAGYATGAAKSYINDTSNANMTVGLTINQGANDDEAIALKSSDVAHGMTGTAETDTYGVLSKVSGADGGLEVLGYSDASAAVALRGRAVSEDTTKSTAGVAACQITAQLKSGTGAGAMSANANLLAVRNDTTTRFILDADGDSHQDVGTAWTEFDAFDDVALLDDLNTALTGRDRIKDGFRAFVQYNRKALERAKLVTFHTNGHHFVNMSKLTMAHTGAIRQIGNELSRVRKALVAQKLLPEAS